MHGWFHFEWWIAMAKNWGGYQFRPYNAGSTAGLALQNQLVALLYALGVVAAVFHFVNGIWSAGVTWGVWTRPKAQARALTICMAAGAVLCVIGFGSIYGMREMGRPENVEAAQATEDQMYELKSAAGIIPVDEHKRSHRPKEGPAEIRSSKPKNAPPQEENH